MNNAANGTVTATDAETAATTNRRTARELVAATHGGRTQLPVDTNVVRVHVALLAVMANRLTTDQLGNQR
jgi:hypothetical protein